MGKRINANKVKEIISLFKTNMNDSDIAGEFDVSISYVNKLRNSYKKHEKENEEAIDDKEYIVITETTTLDEINILELKINSLKQTLKWYEELLSIKKQKIIRYKSKL